MGHLTEKWITADSKLDSLRKDKNVSTVECTNISLTGT